MFAALSPIASGGSITLTEQLLAVGVWSEAWMPHGKFITLGSTMLALGTVPPAVTLAATPTSVTGLWLDIVANGPLGGATFAWSADDGASYSEPIATAAEVDLGNGYVLQFAAGTYYPDDLYKATVAAWTGLWGYTASQATASKQPVYSSVAWDGNPCLVFDGVDDILVCSASALVSPYAGSDVDTVLVAAHDSVDNAATLVCLGGSSTGSCHYHLMVTTGNESYYRYAQNVSAAVVGGRRHVVCLNTGTLLEVLRNGVSIVGPTAKTSTTMDPTQLSIGAYQRSDAYTTYFTAGNIAAVLLGSTCSDAAGLTALLEANGVPYA